MNPTITGVSCALSPSLCTFQCGQTQGTSVWPSYWQRILLRATEDGHIWHISEDRWRWARYWDGMGTHKVHLPLFLCQLEFWTWKTLIQQLMDSGNLSSFVLSVCLLSLVSALGGQDPITVTMMTPRPPKLKKVEWEYYKQLDSVSFSNYLKKYCRTKTSHWGIHIKCFYRRIQEHKSSWVTTELGKTGQWAMQWEHSGPTEASILRDAPPQNHSLSVQGPSPALLKWYFWFGVKLRLIEYSSGYSPL